MAAERTQWLVLLVRTWFYILKYLVTFRVMSPLFHGENGMKSNFKFLHFRIYISITP
jgi:hypothetical protein